MPDGLQSRILALSGRDRRAPLLLLEDDCTAEVTAVLDRLGAYRTGREIRTCRQ